MPKFVENYKLTDARSLTNPKYKKHEENYFKEHIISKLYKISDKKKSFNSPEEKEVMHRKQR